MSSRGMSSLHHMEYMRYLEYMEYMRYMEYMEHMDYMKYKEYQQKDEIIGGQTCKEFQGSGWAIEAICLLLVVKVIDEELPQLT